jgi:hypothetical protein
MRRKTRYAHHMANPGFKPVLNAPAHKKRPAAFKPRALYKNL